LKNDVNLGIKLVIIPDDKGQLKIHYSVIYSAIVLQIQNKVYVKHFSQIDLIPKQYVANDASETIIDWEKTNNDKNILQVVGEQRKYGDFDYIDDMKQNKDKYQCDYIVTRKEKTIIDKFKFGFVYLNNINPSNDEIRDMRLKYLKSVKRHSNDLIEIELKQLKTKIFQESDIIYKTKTYCFDYEEETVNDTLIMWVSRFPIIIHTIDLTCQSPTKSSLRKGFTRFTKLF